MLYTKTVDLNWPTDTVPVLLLKANFCFNVIHSSRVDSASAVESCRREEKLQASAHCRKTQYCVPIQNVSFLSAKGGEKLCALFFVGGIWCRVQSTTPNVVREEHVFVDLMGRHIVLLPTQPRFPTGTHNLLLRGSSSLDNQSTFCFTWCMRRLGLFATQTGNVLNPHRLNPRESAGRNVLYQVGSHAT